VGDLLTRLEGTVGPLERYYCYSYYFYVRWSDNFNCKLCGMILADLDELRRSVSSCMWLTYRKNFPSVGDTALTSDKGWGCMIRTGQMLLAKTLLLRHLGESRKTRGV